MEKKEKLENAEERVKIRFVLFISFLFYGLSVFWDCIFWFVMRIRDKKTKVNRENGSTLLLFLIFSNFDLTRETRPQFSNPDGLIAIRTIHCVFLCIAGFGVKRTVLRDDSRLTESICTVQSKFQNHESKAVVSKLS